MKYCVLIMDGAAGWPLPERGGKTCLELAHTPNLDAMTQEGTLGLARTVPPGMEPSSAIACMSVLGYDPAVYYKGRATIEAQAMGIPVNKGEVVFRCNLVAIRDGRMLDYSTGHISSENAKQLIDALNKNPGDDLVHFFPGVSYRHICKIKGREEALQATCTPAHDIPGKPIQEFMPHGPGSDVLVDLMLRSQKVLAEHPLNVKRQSRGEVPATMIWLFWGSGRVPEMPSFQQVYGQRAAMTTGVDLLRGLARMSKMDILDVPGVTDGLDNDYAAQVQAAIQALDKHDLVVIHVEAPDEAAHGGSIDDKIEAIQKIDKDIASKLPSIDNLRLLVMPDHPTPIKIQTHSPEPVPFLLWGKGFAPNGAKRLTEAEAARTGLCVDPGYNIMGKLIKSEG